MMKEVIRKQKELESGLGASHEKENAQLVKGHKEKDAKESGEEEMKRKIEQENEVIKAQIAARALEQQLELERINTEKEEKKKSAEKTNEEVWSADEQSALENALKSVGKDENERWEKIAAIVKTKNKKQCLARVKHIKEEIMKKKGGK